MRSFLVTAVLVFGGIWLWARLTGKTAAAKPNTTSTVVPVDSGVFFGPEIDPKTGAYLPPGATVGSVGYQTQPVGLA